MPSILVGEHPLEVLAMLFRHELLETLCCPVGRSPLRMMTQRELDELNAAIARGGARYASGERVDEALEGGLAAIDGTSAYRVQAGVPVLLPEQRILCSGSDPESGQVRQNRKEDKAFADRWEQFSLNWDTFQPPLRPAPQDIDLLERLVGEALGGACSVRPRALLLGVTPEIATMRWPAGTQLLAADSSEPMIRNVWPGRAVPDALVVRADWTMMPVHDAAFDIVVGDGSVNVPPYPDSFFAIVREVRRLLKDSGVLAMRVFARPEEREPIERIFADLRGGRIGNLGIFRWRLAMALHGDLAAGTRMGDLWEAWEANVPDPEELMRSLDWPLEQLGPIINSTRGYEGRTIFPTVNELREALAPDFEQTAWHVPDYETGDRYPTLVFTPRPRRDGRSRA
jgi:uncharacterized protein YbaR (Trm112 family)/SAM-dependent methyltransferase